MKKTYVKLIKYFIIISIIIISILPIYNFYDYAKKYDYSKLFNTDTIEEYINYTVYKLFNRSLVQDSVITGKDDFLFLGNKYKNVLHKTNGIYRPSDKEIDEWTNKLRDLQSWYEDRGIKFVLVIAPNKHTIYREKLPNWMKYSGKTITDDIVKHTNKKNINVLDLRQILINNKKDKTLYMKTDTHWNNVGASIGYDATIAYINNTYRINLAKPTYIIKNKYRDAGDLANFLKIKTLLADDYENVYTFDFGYDYYVCNGKINRDNNALEKCENVINPYMYINSKPQYMINNNSLNKQKLLWLCDSYAGGDGGKVANSQLYNATFQIIWKWHFGQINGSRLSDFINKYKPDFVIYQIVERDLYKQYILKKLPKISVIDSGVPLEQKDLIFNINNPIYEYYKNDRFTIKDKELSVSHKDPIIILNKLSSKSKLVTLNYKINSIQNTNFQLFYKENIKDKYSETSSYRVPIKKGVNNITLLIPSKYINNQLRIDLAEKIGKYQIENLSIYEVE